MTGRKYYVLCEQNCKFESMTKEQILTAITQAVENGKIKDVDTGFVSTIKTINGEPLKFFVGQQSEYDSLSESEKENLFAIITNDTTKEALFALVEELRTEMNAIEQGFADGAIFNYGYIGARTEKNMRLLRGTAATHVNLDEYNSSAHSGNFALMWEDVRNGYVDGLPSFEIEGGYAANFDVVADYNDSMATVFQYLRLRAVQANNNANLLLFTRCYNGTGWSNWMRFVSAEEIESGTVRAGKAEHANEAYTADRATFADKATDSTNAVTAENALLASNANNDRWGASIHSNYLHIGTKTAENFMLLRGNEQSPIDIDLLQTSGNFALFWEDVRNGYVVGLPDIQITGGYAANLYVSNDYNETTSAMKTAYQLLELRAPVRIGNETLLMFHRYHNGSDGWSNWLRFISAEEVERNYIKNVIKETEYETSTGIGLTAIGLGDIPAGVLFTDSEDLGILEYYDFNIYRYLLDDNSMYLIRFSKDTDTEYSFTICTSTKPEKDGSTRYCYSSASGDYRIRYSIFYSAYFDAYIAVMSLMSGTNDYAGHITMKITKIAELT